MSGQLSWDGNPQPIKFDFKLVDTEDTVEGDAEATTAQGGAKGALSGGFRVKIDLPASFPITYSLASLKITFGDIPGQVVQLDRSNSRGTTVRAIVPAGLEAETIDVVVWNENYQHNTAKFEFEYIDDRIPQILSVLPARIYGDVASEIRVIITKLDLQRVGKDDVELTMIYQESGEAIGTPAVQSLEPIDTDDLDDVRSRITFFSVPSTIANDEKVQVRVAFGGRASLFEITYVAAPGGSPVIASMEPQEGMCNDGRVKVKLRLTGIRMITDDATLHASAHGQGQSRV